MSNADWWQAVEKRDKALADLRANRRMDLGTYHEASNQIHKQYHIDIGAEVLTPDAAAYLFDKSPERVRQARREAPEVAVQFELFFSPTGRPVHMLNLGWAKTVWAEPPDYLARLETLRENGWVHANPGSNLVLSTVNVLEWMKAGRREEEESVTLEDFTVCTET
jgi:hypothetical protein